MRFSANREAYDEITLALGEIVRCRNPHFSAVRLVLILVLATALDDLCLIHDCFSSLGGLAARFPVVNSFSLRVIKPRH
jgi:hypothetical protein